MKRVTPLLIALTVLLIAAPGPAGAGPQAGPQTAAARISWLDGPCVGELGQHAEIAVPAGFKFTDSAGARAFMEATQNPSSGHEMGVVVDPEHEWFVIFEFSPIGYVKDDEKDRLDAAAILQSIQKGNDAANEERRRRGWGVVTIEGWQQQPFYDAATHNLVWAIRGNSDGTTVVNHSTRLLGREGVMNVDLVLSPAQLNDAVPKLAEILQGFSFKPGKRYAEWRTGDKVAAYGLTALVGGGLGAAAVKSGLLAKLWKVIVVAVLAVVAAIKKIFASIFGRKKDATQYEYR